MYINQLVFYILCLRRKYIAYNTIRIYISEEKDLYQLNLFYVEKYILKLYKTKIS